MSHRFAAALAVIACAVGPFSLSTTANAAPAGRNNEHDCGVFAAHDDAIQGELDAIDDIIAGYFTSWVGSSFFGHDDYEEPDEEGIRALLDATSRLSTQADHARANVHTRGASLAFSRIANDSRILHTSVEKVVSREYRPRQLGMSKDVLFRSMNNYHNAYSLACNGDIVDPRF